MFRIEILFHSLSPEIDTLKKKVQTAIAEAFPETKIAFESGSGSTVNGWYALIFDVYEKDEDRIKEVIHVLNTTEGIQEARIVK